MFKEKNNGGNTKESENINSAGLTFIKPKIKLKGAEVNSSYILPSCGVCDHEIKMGNDFTFCPYCGRKIAYTDYVTPFENVNAASIFN